MRISSTGFGGRGLGSGVGRGLGRPLSRAAGRSHALETLEARTLLSDTPLPALTDLESVNNAVIRFETNYGDVDIELFSDAPITANNFMNSYVLTGKLDLTFFHRATTDASASLAVIQGGGFYFEDGQAPTGVDTVSPIVLEAAAVRLNLARTLSMARTSAPNSATSQFFINVNDNNDVLPAGSANGYAVFGRVIQGWQTVLNIAGLARTDINGDVPIAGSPFAGTFNETPTGNTYNPADDVVREEDLAYIINAEVIKPSGANDFFNQRMVYPEGNRTDSSSETINFHNPNSVGALYQMIVRYEYLKREEVISRGTIPANTSLALPLSIAGQTSPNLVRVDSPYAIIVETSLPPNTANPLPVGVSSTRTDFGATTSEEFFNVFGVADATLRTWDFARVERNDLSREFLTWVNLSDTTATVTLTFFTNGVAPITATYTTEAFRRGGAEVFSLVGTATLPDGVYGVRVSSTQNIVAELSDWDVAFPGEDPNLSYTPGWAVLGTPGGTSTAGSIPQADILTGYSSIVSFVNPNATVAVITLSFWRDSRGVGSPPIQRIVPPIAANSRADYLLDSSLLGIPLGERFSITFTSGTAIVGAQYTNVAEVNRNLEAPGFHDGAVSMSAVTRTSAAIIFSNASIDPLRTDGTDISVFSLFNPFANTGVTFNYTLEARFSDGTSISVASGALTANARSDVRLDQNSAIRAKANSGVAFRTYSLVLRGTGTSSSTTHNIAGFAQLSRFDTTTGSSMTTQGMLVGATTAVGASIFLP